MTLQQALQMEVAKVQRSGTLGGTRLRSLFDYLATKSLAGECPKEVTIAIEVFGKPAQFDVARDAIVRVYVHKLRKALESFYSTTTEYGGETLHIPRGEYRLSLGKASSSGAKGEALQGISRVQLWGALLLAILILSVTEIGLREFHKTALDQVRASPIWSDLLADDRPLMIVFGDYYLIGETGETDESVGVRRLVREYSVNSKADLDRYITEHPERANRYVDVNLRYLPVSAANALRQVMAVLAPQNRRITISKMSDLEADSLKNSDIVYIGYLSGMGMFQDLVFAGSRFEVGQSYDEIIDKKTHKTYVSEVGSQVLGPVTPTGKEQAYHDYGIFEKLRGPGGNTMLVIAGTRDEGVSQTAELLSDARSLSDLARRTDLSQSVEGLLEVKAIDGTALTGTVVLQSVRGETAHPQ